MKISFIGSGSAFTVRNSQSNMLIERNGKYLLVDCGGDARKDLFKMGYSANNIDAVFISHGHNDHIGGLEWLGFCRFDFVNKCASETRPTMFAEGSFIKDLWAKGLSLGLECIEGQMVELHDFFKLNPIESNGHFIWEGIKFEIVQTLHMCAKFKIVNSFGLLFESPDTGKKVFITTDTQFAPTNSMLHCYKTADVIFHDCETLYRSGVHAHYQDLKTLEAEYKSKMYLYHYQDNILKSEGVLCDIWKEKASEDGFKGFVMQYSEYDL